MYLLYQYHTHMHTPNQKPVLPAYLQTTGRVPCQRSRGNNQKVFHLNFVHRKADVVIQRDPLYTFQVDPPNAMVLHGFVVVDFVSDVGHGGYLCATQCSIKMLISRHSCSQRNIKIVQDSKRLPDGIQSIVENASCSCKMQRSNET